MTVAAAVAVALVAAGCSSDAGARDLGQPSSDPAASQAATAAPSSDADTTAGGGEAAAGGTDPYCESARDGYEAQLALLDAAAAKSIETGAGEGAGSLELARTAGAAMVDAIDTLVASWNEARAALTESPRDDTDATVSTAAADGAFGDFLAYVDLYARPEATLVASMNSLDEYNEGMLALMDAPGAADSVAVGAVALGHIVSYTRERCGDLGDT